MFLVPLYIFLRAFVIWMWFPTSPVKKMPWRIKLETVVSSVCVVPKNGSHEGASTRLCSDGDDDDGGVSSYRLLPLMVWLVPRHSPPAHYRLAFLPLHSFCADDHTPLVHPWSLSGAGVACCLPVSRQIGADFPMPADSSGLDLRDSPS